MNLSLRTALRSRVRAFVARCRQPLASPTTPCGEEPEDRAATLSPSLNADTAPSRLGEEKEFLLAFIRDVETEFLANGEGLERLARQLDGIRARCQSLTELTVGQGPDAAVQFGFQLLKKAEDLVLASHEQYDHVFATFDELRRRLGLLARRHDDLMRALRPLNSITIALRIEASRQPADVRQTFFALADDVGQTVDEVRHAMARQFSDLAAGERITGELMGRVSASILRNRQEVAAILATGRDRLHTLDKTLAGSGAGVADFCRLGQEIGRHINGIVMAQQCQDITRQQLEHVGEAMDEMRAHLNEAHVANAPGADETRRFLLHAARIQARQIETVFDRLHQAAAALETGMRNLRREAGLAAETAIATGGATLDAGITGQCQDGIAEVLRILREAVKSIDEVTGAFAPLQASFVDCTGKAAKLADDVRNAGLNAQIFAVHAHEGAALETLAARVHGISEEVIAQVGEMGAELNTTTAMVNELRQRLEDFKILGEAEESVLARELETSRERFSTLMDTVPNLILLIGREQQAFAQSVEAILAKVRFPATVAVARSRSAAFFRDLVAWAGGDDQDAVAVDEAGTMQKVERLRSRYTMEAERLTHASALQKPHATETSFRDADEPAAAIALPEHDPLIDGFDDFASLAPLAAGAAAPAPATKKPAPVEDLGDNVELF